MPASEMEKDQGAERLESPEICKNLHLWFIITKRLSEEAEFRVIYETRRADLACPRMYVYNMFKGQVHLCYQERVNYELAPRGKRNTTFEDDAALLNAKW